MPEAITRRRVLLGAASGSALATLPLHARAAVSSQPSAPLARLLGEAMPGARSISSATLTWLGLKVYDVHLWVGQGGFDASRWKDIPFALELHYLRALKGKLIAERSATEIEKLGYGTAEQRAAWLESMARLFPDVSRHDRITGLHRPDKGAIFFANDKPLGTIDDPVFGEAFFAIWLDPRTVAPALRKSLLAGVSGSARATN